MMRLLPAALAAWLMLPICLPGPRAWAAPPVLRDLVPSGGQRGQTVSVRLVGEHLSPGLELHSALPGPWREIPPAKGQGPGTFVVDIPAHTPPGYYPVR